MSGNMGKCPTCKNPISLNATVCPNCGETHFSIVRKTGRIIGEARKCIFCNGKGRTKGLYSNFWDKDRECGSCNGSGVTGLYEEIEYIDTRVER